MPNEDTPDSIQVVGLGEALFDRFPSQDILGGAPLNMAFHAHQILMLFGGSGTIVTRVGKDAFGERAIRQLDRMGITTDFVQRDSQRRTGEVVVTPIDGDHHFSIIRDVAWDYIGFPPHARELAESCHAVCYGTLAQRHDVSRKSIRAFVSHAKNALKVFDVNLRSDSFEEEGLRINLKAANVVKCNQVEIRAIQQQLRLPVETDTELARRLLGDFQLDLVALTNGSQGTTLISSDRVVDGVVPQWDCAPNADSVGAGDASCAGITCGLLLNWSLDKALELSNQMGAYVASQPGATPTLNERMKDWIQALSQRPE